MFSDLRRRARSQEGFTLIELLVVILIIGILAAIALPAFLGQQSKGQDSDAKSNARNAVTQMESCFQDNQTYAGCQTLTGSGLKVGSNQGQVQVTLPTAKGYTVTAVSKSGNTFVITKSATDGTVARTCQIGTGSDKGGCTASWITAS